MPLINLIKEQRLVTQTRERQTRMAVMGATAVAGLALLSGLFFMVDATRLNISAFILEGKKKQMEPLLNQLKDNQDKIEELKPRLATLEQAQSNTQKWSRILVHLTKNTPSGSWLTSLKAQQTDKTKPLTITLDGIAVSQERVGELILRLENSQDIENVHLIYTQEKVNEKQIKQTEFEVSADLVGSKQEDTSKEKKV